MSNKTTAATPFGRRGALALLCSGVAARVVLVMPTQAQKVVQPNAVAAGQWKLIGQTHADHAADHDAIVVKGPFDNFRRIKFKVTDAPLNMMHRVVVYDSGQPDRIEVRQNIPKGGESRVIDLRGIGKRSLRRIDLGDDTKGHLSGKADVTLSA